MRAEFFHAGRLFGACALLPLALAACAPAPAAPSPQRGDLPRIVSLNPCVDAVLVEVAAPMQVLALSHYSRDPAASSIDPATAARFAVTGGSVEEVVALAPDLVLADTFTAPSTRQALADLDIPVRYFGIAATPQDSIAQVREIAGAVGQRARGEALAQRIEQALAADAAPSGVAPLGAVLWQPGQIVPGEATLVQQLMERAGFASHSAARGLGQADFLALERLLADPPDVLLVAGDARAQRHPALAGLNHTHIARFDPALLYCGGPTIIRAMERLAQVRDEMAP